MSANRPTPSPAMNAAPIVVASATGDTSIGQLAASANAWANVGLALIPPSMRTVWMSTPLSARAASIRSAPRWAMPSSTARTTWGRAGAAGDAEQRASGPVVPAWGCRGPGAQGRRRRRRCRRTSTATSWLSALVAISPRSSRSHSTLVPADSMIASTPQVILPSRDHSGSGYVPASWRCAPDGVPVSVHRSSIPPVPNVIFARPGLTQLCPISDAC